MDRVIFCPNEEMLEEAQKLSRLHIAPILMGENERTKTLLFDRSKPIPLMIPTNHYVEIMPTQPTVFNKFVIKYFNDYIKLPDGARIKLLSEKIGEPNGYIFPQIFESGQHRIFCSMRSGEEDHFTAYIFKDDVIFDSFEFDVISGKENNNDR
jgi:hypothetical protein